MHLPFTTEQFFEVFRNYNTAVWPAQVVLLALAVAAGVLVTVQKPWSGAGISLILALLWIWIGAVYHAAFFTSINLLAYLFAALSLAGAVSFLWSGVVRRELQFRWAINPRTLSAMALIVFALVIYPAWTLSSGHHYPAFPTFGLPCPTTLFTIGLLGFLVPPYPRGPIVVPTLWCFVGTQAAFLLGVRADLGLLAAGAFGVVLLTQSRA